MSTEVKDLFGKRLPTGHEIVDELKLGESAPLLKPSADKFALLENTVKVELLPVLIFDIQLEPF